MHNILVMCTFMGHKWVQGGPLGPPETSKRTLGWTFGAMKTALVLGVSLNLLALNYTVMVGEKNGVDTKNELVLMDAHSHTQFRLRIRGCDIHCEFNLHVWSQVC